MAPAQHDQQHQQQQRPTFREYAESLLVTVILALFGTTFLVQAFKIPSSSMERTLLVGDHLLVSKFNFAEPSRLINAALPYRDIARGDIIVFKYPYAPFPHFVKRVVGLPGDHVRIEDRTVLINGKPLDEPYAIRDGTLPSRLNEKFPGNAANLYYMDAVWRDEIEGLREGDDLVLPVGKYFVLGDNRDNSRDSRYWGLVDRTNIIGRPLLIYWSLARPDDHLSLSAEANGTEGAGLVDGFIARMRWKRFFHLVR